MFDWQTGAHRPLLLYAHRIRDMNDEINKLIREKGHWERHIVELGGPDYSKIAAAAAAADGQDASNGMFGSHTCLGHAGKGTPVVCRSNMVLASVSN